MAIKILRQGLPTIGRCVIGLRTPKNGDRGGAPMKIDHFELTATDRDRDGRLFPDIAVMRKLLQQGVATCGGCDRSKELAEEYNVPEFVHGLPIQLGILLPYDSIELNFPNRLAYHKGRTEFCRGDGETAERRMIAGHKNVQGKQVEILGPFQPHGPCGSACPDFDTRRCKPKARLRFVLSAQENVGGCFEFRTTSWNSIANLQESLQMIQMFTNGALQWIPLFLELVPQTVQPKDSDRANTAYIARVTFPGGPQKLLATVKENLQLRAPLMREIRQLEAQLEKKTWDMTPAEIDDFRQEFDPDNLAAEERAGVLAATESDLSDGGSGDEPIAAPGIREDAATAHVRTSTAQDDGPERGSGAAGEAPASQPSTPSDSPALASTSGAPPAQAGLPLDPSGPAYPLSGDDQRTLWQACKKRAGEIKLEASAVLSATLTRHGYSKTQQVEREDFSKLLETARTLSKTADA